MPRYTPFISAFVLLVGATTVLAQTATPQNTPPAPPAWMYEDSVDTAAFQQVVYVQPIEGISVPTVVEVPVRGSALADKRAVVEDQCGTFGPAYFNTEIRIHGIEIAVRSEDATLSNPSALTDNNTTTYQDFPYTEGQTNRVSLLLELAQPTRTSELFVTLSPNVALPKSVRVTGLPTGEEAVYADARVLVSERPMTSARVRFPETTVSLVLVEFSLTQPLRLAEIGLVSGELAERTEGMRFLAHPDTSYTLYLNPDRTYGAVSSGGVDLREDAGVLALPQLMVAANPRYVPADDDEDGIPNARDNCPRTANPDQTDQNTNGVGDACDDHDRDGVMTVHDNCPDTPNRDQRDTDADGMGDACDSEESRFTEQYPWLPWVGMLAAGGVLAGLLAATLRFRPEERTETAEHAEPEQGPGTPQA